MDSKLLGTWKQTALTQCHNHAPFHPAAHQPTENIECSSLWSNMKCDNSKKKSTTDLRHTVSSSMSSSSSGTCGGLKKLKKLSQSSVLVIGFVFFEPFLGFFFRIFCVRFFPGYQSMSVLQTQCVQ